ncbi:MAG: hypothetical protein SFU85_05250 [Candidatus Methylacidiphilales bacterium]|nr:hypothetical protein [Candidatus Methylacidiphilales bacterium]
MNLIYGVLSFLGPGLLGHSLASATGGLTHQDGILLMWVLPGLAWVLFGALCPLIFGWSLMTAARICLRSMAAGSMLLGLASLGSCFDSGIAWYVVSILASHVLMLGVFVLNGRRLGTSVINLLIGWFIGLDGAALFLTGAVLWV